MKKYRNLDNLLDMILKEDNPAPAPTNMADFAPVETQTNVSLDQAIDRYVVRYEKESIPTSETYEKRIEPETKLESFVRRMLNEAEEVPNPTGEEDVGSASMDDGLGDMTPQPVMATPQINLNDFARSVARLVNNYDALLNPKEIIINRVAEYVKNNYDERTSREFLELLSTNYNISTLKAQQDKLDSIPTPQAAGSLSTEG